MEYFSEQQVRELIGKKILVKKGTGGLLVGEKGFIQKEHKVNQEDYMAILWVIPEKGRQHKLYAINQTEFQSNIELLENSG